MNIFRPTIKDLSLTAAHSTQSEGLQQTIGLEQFGGAKPEALGLLKRKKRTDNAISCMWHRTSSSDDS